MTRATREMPIKPPGAHGVCPRIAPRVLACAALAGQRVAPQFSEDSEQQRLTLSLGAALQPGQYTLSIDYHGRIYGHSTGLFALDYDTANGNSRQRALYTHFEPAEARRFV